MVQILIFIFLNIISAIIMYWNAEKNRYASEFSIKLSYFLMGVNCAFIIFSILRIFKL